MILKAKCGVDRRLSGGRGRKWRGGAKPLSSELVAYLKQSGPDSGPDFLAKVCKTFYVVPSSLGSGSDKTL